MPTQLPLPQSPRDRLKDVSCTKSRTSTLVKEVNVKCAWCSLGQNRTLCPVCSCFKETNLSIKELEVDVSESATPTKEVFNFGNQTTSQKVNDKELRKVADALAAEDNFDLGNDIDVSMTKKLQEIVADFNIKKSLANEHPAGNSRNPVAGSKGKPLEDFAIGISSLPPLKVDFDVLDLISRPSSKSSFSTYGSLRRPEQGNNERSTVCDKNTVDVVDTQWEVTMISPEASTLAGEPNCAHTEQHLECADPVWGWEFTIPHKDGAPASFALERAADFGIYADQKASTANPPNSDKGVKMTHRISETDRIVHGAYEADENVQRGASKRSRTKVLATRQQKKSNKKRSKKRPLQQQTSFRQEVSGSMRRDPRPQGAAIMAPQVDSVQPKIARRKSQTRTEAHSSPTFRLGVHLVRFSNMGIAAVAQKLDIQPQEPRTLKRYSIGIPTVRKVRSNIKRGITDYKLKLENLRLNEKLVPAIACHFFPEGVQFAHGQTLEPPDPNADLCPAPTRQVGEIWSGSNGTYKCVRHEPCGCPGNLGSIAIIKKTANRRKKRHKAGPSRKKRAPSPAKAPTTQPRTSAI